MELLSKFQIAHCWLIEMKLIFILILYPSGLLNLLIISNQDWLFFVWDFFFFSSTLLGIFFFLINKTISSENKKFYFFLFTI